LLLLLLFVPALVFVTACDSGGNGGSDDVDPTDQEQTNVEEDIDDDGTVDRVVVADVDDNGVIPGGGDGEITWESDKTYVLNGFVFVNDGQTLNIEPGTVVQGRGGSGSRASALIVTAGGTINADGNPGSSDPADADPIVFTSTNDNDDGTSALESNVRGLWGGVILLGDATISEETKVQKIEGVPDDLGGERIEYGAVDGSFDNNHNVGTFRFVTIRHTGTQLGGGDEIQGLTMGGVGSGSTIEYVESYASDDDGFEWFGGTVNTNHLIAAFTSDDNFDIDQGYAGNGQFWLAVQSTDAAGRISEMDGSKDPEVGARVVSNGIIANATYIGVGPGNTSVPGDGGQPMIFQRDNNSTSYYNSIFMDGPVTEEGGLHFEEQPDDEFTEDSFANFLDGDFVHKNNLWYNVGDNFDGNTTFEEIIAITETENDVDINPDQAKDIADEYKKDNELVTSSPIQSISRSGGVGVPNFDPTPTNDATSGAASLPSGEPGLTDTNYRGAFAPSGPNSDWADGWTTIEAKGELQ
jgi:hypothetical protein